MNADGSGQTALTNDPAQDFSPAWSPTGTKIAFARLRADFGGQIYAMDADGSDQTNLSNNPAVDDGFPPGRRPGRTWLLAVRTGSTRVTSGS